MMAGERILIVEDDDYLRKASEIALRRAGYVVISTPTGREGLNLARSERPDLIILDLLMPQPTGLEILRTLRGEPATKATPVMVISNSSMQRVVDEVTALGAEYIVKADLSLRELAGRVERRLPPPASTPAPAAAAPAAAPAAPKPAAPAPAAPAAAAVPQGGPPPHIAASVAAAAVRERREPPPRPVTEETHECAACGAPNLTSAQFCSKCGRQLGAAIGGRRWKADTR
jgi:CheY-like chemotaxis protein